MRPQKGFDLIVNSLGSSTFKGCENHRKYKLNFDRHDTMSLDNKFVYQITFETCL